MIAETKSVTLAARVATFLAAGLFALSGAVVTGGCSAEAANNDEATSSSSADLARGDAIGRAEEWVNARLQYCQSANGARDYDSSCSAYCHRTSNAAWDAYRSDCSGLVSWAWGLGAPGRTTLGFAPFVNDITQVIAAAALQPGDAVNNADHVMLFKAWTVPGEAATFIEEPGCSSSTPYAHEFTSQVSISGSSIHVAFNGMTFTSIRLSSIQPGAGSGNETAPVYEPSYRGVARDATGKGYWILGADGGMFSYGDAPFEGSLGGKTLNAPVAGVAATPDGKGYWIVANDGGLFAFGNAPFAGSMGGKKLNAPVVGMAATPSGKGYWMVAADGGMFAFGDAPFQGSMGGKSLNAPVVGMAATPTGKGYWLVASDGGLFAFGDAPFEGSMGGKALNAAVVGMAATPTGNGYWLVAADGGLFAFGDAAFYGSMGGKTLNAPIVGMTATPSGRGYWLVGGDGGLFTFGDAGFYGSRG